MKTLSLFTHFALSSLLACGSVERLSVGEGAPSNAGESAAVDAGQGGGGRGVGGRSATQGGDTQAAGAPSSGTDSGGMTTSGGNAGTGGAPPLSACSIPGTSQIPRLTPEQYDRTVRDLLGVTTLTAFDGQPPSAILAPSHDGDVTERDWDGYMAAGEAIAAQVMTTSALRTRFLSCRLTGDVSACFHDTIVKFGRLAFRRPLTANEVARFEKIVDRGAQITVTGTSEEIAEVLLQTFLVSPSFLQRSEISETPNARLNFVLSPHEVASRLSYMLWGSTPDDALNQAADAGELTTKEQIRAQGERMLKDEKARELVASFHRFYLGLGPNTIWTTVQKDEALFPAFNDAVAKAMTAETEKFFDAVVFAQQGSFQDLLTSPLGFVNADTAPIYGLDPSEFGSALEQVALDVSQRPGFLTRIGFLAAYSHFGRTAPVLRGAFIDREILGLGLGAPTVDGPATPLPQDISLRTNRERVAAQTAGVACAGCHQTYLNPPGFVLEAYDAIGAWQTVEADTLAAIDTVAEVFLDGAAVTVRDPAELMQKLAASKDAQRRYAKRWVDFAYGREGNPQDACTVAELATNITRTGYTILDLLLDLTQTDSFRIRALEVTL